MPAPGPLHSLGTRSSGLVVGKAHNGNHLLRLLLSLGGCAVTDPDCFGLTKSWAQVLRRLLALRLHSDGNQKQPETTRTCETAVATLPPDVESLSKEDCTEALSDERYTACNKTNSIELPSVFSSTLAFQNLGTPL